MASLDGAFEVTVGSCECESNTHECWKYYKVIHLNLQPSQQQTNEELTAEAEMMISRAAKHTPNRTSKDKSSGIPAARFGQSQAWIKIRA